MNSFQKAQAEARGPSPVPGFDKKLDEIDKEIKYDKKKAEVEVREPLPVLSFCQQN